MKKFMEDNFFYVGFFLILIGSGFCSLIIDILKIYHPDTSCKSEIHRIDNDFKTIKCPQNSISKIENNMIICQCKEDK